MSINNFSIPDVYTHRELWWGDITPYDFSAVRPTKPYPVPIPEYVPQVLKYDEINISLYAACGKALASWSALETEIQHLRKNLSPTDASWEIQKKSIQHLIAQREQKIQAVFDLMGQMADRMTKEQRQKYYKKLTSWNWVFWSNESARNVRQKQKQLSHEALEMQSLAKVALQNLEELEQIWQQDLDSGDLLHAIAQCHTRSNKENRAMLDALYTSDPAAYRYQSHAYLQSVIQNERWQEASKFAVSWMQSIHNDAPWSDVEKMAMGLILSQKSSATSHATAAQFLQAFQTWQAQRPELSLAATHPVIEPEAGQPYTEAMQAQLMLSRLHVIAQDTSLNAYIHYTNASMLQPDAPEHRLGLALIDIATGRWQQAQEHIDLLPEEWRAPISTQLMSARYSVIDLTVEIAHRAFSNFVIPLVQNKASFGSKGRLAVQTFNGALQLVAHPAIKMPLVARSMANGDLLLQQPVSPITKCSFALLLSTVASPLIVPPIIVEWMPDPVKRTAYIGRIENVALPALRTIGHLSLAIFSGAKIVSTCAYSLPDIAFSTAQAGIYLSGKPLSITSQAAFTATGRIVGKVSAAMTGYAYRGAIGIIAKNTLARVVSQRVCLAVGQTLGRLSVANAIPTISIAAASLSLAHTIFWDFPKTRTALLLNRVSLLCAHRQTDMANHLLQSAAEWLPFMSDQKVIAAYRTCIPFLQKIPTLTHSVEDRQFVLDDSACAHTLNTLESSSYYADAASDLQYRQIIASIQTDQIDQAQQALYKLPTHSPIPPQLVNFAIDTAATYHERQDAKHYLQSLMRCFPENSTTHTIFHEYCIYLDHQINFPEISYELNNIGNILRYQSIDKLLELTDTSALAPTQSMLYFEALQIALATADQQKAKQFLKHLNSYAQALAAEAVIEQAQELLKSGDSIRAMHYLENASAVIVYVHAPMIAKYLALTRLEEAHPILSLKTPQAVVVARLEAIDAVVNASRKEINIRPELYSKKLFVYVHTYRYEEASILLTQHTFPEADQYKIVKQAISHCVQCLSQRNYMLIHQLLKLFQNIPDIHRMIFDGLAYTCVAKISDLAVLQNIREALPSLFNHALMRQHWRIWVKFYDPMHNALLQDSLLQELNTLEATIHQMHRPLPNWIHEMRLNLHIAIGSDAFEKHSWISARRHLSCAQQLLLTDQCTLHREQTTQMIRWQLSQIPPE